MNNPKRGKYSKAKVSQNVKYKQFNSLRKAIIIAIPWRYNQ